MWSGNSLYRNNRTTWQDLTTVVKPKAVFADKESLKKLKLSDKSIKAVLKLIKVSDSPDTVFAAVKNLLGGLVQDVSAESGETAKILVAWGRPDTSLIYDNSKSKFMVGTEESWKEIYAPPAPAVNPHFPSTDTGHYVRRRRRLPNIRRSPDVPLSRDEKMRQATAIWVSGGDRGTRVDKSDFETISQLRSAIEKEQLIMVDATEGYAEVSVSTPAGVMSYRFDSTSELLRFLDKKPMWYDRKKIRWNGVTVDFTSKFLTDKFREFRESFLGKTWNELLEQHLSEIGWMKKIAARVSDTSRRTQDRYSRMFDIRSRKEGAGKAIRKAAKLWKQRSGQEPVPA